MNLKKNMIKFLKNGQNLKVREFLNKFDEIIKTI